MRLASGKLLQSKGNSQQNEKIFLSDKEAKHQSIKSLKQSSDKRWYHNWTRTQGSCLPVSSPLNPTCVNQSHLMTRVAHIRTYQYHGPTLESEHLPSPGPPFNEIVVQIRQYFRCDVRGCEDFLPRPVSLTFSAGLCEDPAHGLTKWTQLLHDRVLHLV